MVLDIPGRVHAEADSASLAQAGGPPETAGTGTLTLRNGWMQKDGDERVEFDTATLAATVDPRDPTTHPTSITWTGLSAPLGVGHVTAASATTSLAPGAGWLASSLAVAPCACDDGKPTAVTLSARTASIPGEDQPAFVLIRGGIVRLFTVPVLPLPPVRIPLDPDRFRLLLPEAGYGTSGLSASLSGQGSVDRWRLTGGPAWRQDRGFRAQLEAKGPSPEQDRLGGHSAGALGWDSETGTLRGAVSTEGGVVTGSPSLRVGWDADVQTDTAYGDDYGLDWVARGLPRQEQRAVVALGSDRLGVGRLALHGVTDDEGRWPLEMVETRLRKAWDLSQASDNTATIALRTAFAGWGTSWDELRPMGEVGAEAYGSWSAGPLRFAGRADGALLALSSDESGGSAGGTASAELPMWTGRLQLWPGLVSTGHMLAAPEQGSPVEQYAFLGAGTRADLVAGPWLFVASGHAGRDEQGWTGRVTADLEGPVHLALRAGRRQQGAEAGFTSRPFSVALGTVHRPPDTTEEGGWLVWGSADVRVSRLRFGGGASTPVGTGAPRQLWSARALAGYDDGCSRLLLTVAESPDRGFPDLGVRLEVKR